MQNTQFAYVGCRTTRERNARGKGLKVYVVEGADWREIQLLEGLDNPSYQCIDHTGSFLYTVHGDVYKVSAFSINRATGELSFLNSVEIGGRNPVYITVDRTNQYLFVAALQGGAVYTLKREADGSLSAPVHQFGIEGKTAGGVSLAHQCLLDHAGEHLFVPTQGRGQGYASVNVFKPQPDGSLLQTQCWRAREYAECRHVAVHPNDRWVYLVNEKDNTVVYHQFDRQAGGLAPCQILPCLPETYTGDGQASGILCHPNGGFVYLSNRIHDSIAIYRVDPFTGYLTLQEFAPCLGVTPRFICFSPDGQLFYAANEDSDTIRIFACDGHTGRLTFTGKTVETESPVCVTFLSVV